ncbi:winged helix-turn-helix domain-containing protein [Aquincola sp. S2]|uniref:Winged helix-turn-helix domain-containing protein n=1 Tax=Pseudaquabacterium terrae TaxID=2732868 RepID=A0ABX2ERF2_9BURK|nr:winged helix-turn-helix domain-containing protein [Aquabacterium terrae]NRF71211.1 winged helix-turn-helix domain-containing protein [Aquabacterium terrae]
MKVPSSQFLYRFAGAEFNEATGELLVDGRPVAIEPLPARVLLMLLQHPNEVVTKDELFESVWDKRITVDNVLANAITKLRKALGGVAAGCLRSVPRIGYRLTGRVERVAVGSVPLSPLPLEAGMAVPGRSGWSLRRPLGDASSSRVWLAEHGKLGHRRVFKFAVDAQSLRALKREYMLYRLLQRELGEHPGFAAVVDYNFSDQPYFLECVYGGEDLLAWSDGGARLTEMPLKERLALFVQIAGAVAAAHRVGVLHKDIKPRNVLIDRDGDAWRARLTDFGSARALDAERLRAMGLTAMGLTVTQGIDPEVLSGTPLYLAPELLSGEPPTTRSDIFAMGILLYQVVAGDLRRPMASGWQRHIVDPLLVQDIDSATQGEPEHRLASAIDLVHRLSTMDERRAAAEAAAHEASVLQTLKLREQRRALQRPWALGGAILLLLGLGLSLWQLQRERTALHAAELSQRQAHRVTEFLVQDVLTTPDLFKSAQGRPRSMFEVLHHTATAAGDRFKDDPRAEAELRRHVARLYQRMLSTNDALRQFDRAIELLNASARTARDRAKVLEMRLERAELLFEMNEHDDARRELDRIQGLVGGADLESGAELSFLVQRARVSRALAETRWDEALVEARGLKARADRTPHLDAELRNTAWRLLAQILWLTDQPEAAETLLKENIADSAVAANEAAIAMARAAIFRAAQHRDAKRWAPAHAILVQARERLTQVPVPSLLHIAYIDSDRGHVFKGEEQMQSALEQYQKAAHGFGATLGLDHQWTRVTLKNQGDAALGEGRFEQARHLYESNRTWFNANATGGRYPPLDIHLAAAWNRTGRSSDALDLMATLLAERHDDLAKGEGIMLHMAQAEHALALVQLGRRAEGLPLLRRAAHSIRMSPKGEVRPRWFWDRYRSELPDLNH